MDPFNVIVLVAVLLFLIVSLYKELFQPAISFLIAIIALSLFGILAPADILTGFANPQIASILLLLAFGNLLGNASILDKMFSKLFASTSSYTGFLGKLLPSVAGISALINNTPVVALLIPYVHKWSVKNNISISKVLIPLSYAAILGGTATLVGTSTNMLVNAFAEETEFGGFELLDFAWVGVPLIFLGLIYLLVFGRRLLPDHKSMTGEFTANTTEYLVEAIIPETSSYKNKSIQECNLRALKGLFVAEIIRDDRHISAVSPDEVLLPGDLLVLAGNLDAISDLLKKNKDLALPKKSVLDATTKYDIAELVVAQGSYLTGQTVKSSDFRSRYSAALVGIHRNGEKVEGKIGDQVLKTGDTLLVLAGEDFWKKTNSIVKRDFYVISKINDILPLDVRRSMVILIGLITAIMLSAFKILTLFQGLLILLLIAFLTKIIDLRKLRNLLDYNLLIIAALALSLGEAIKSTGVAEYVAAQTVGLSSNFGAIGALVAVYLLTFLFTELMTNIAAAALALPFAASTAAALGITPEPFFLAVAYAASASFITPLGYQTNLMVYGPGGYKFKDFMRIGLPLTILYFVVTILILYFRYFQ